MASLYKELATFQFNCLNGIQNYEEHFFAVYSTRCSKALITSLT